MTQRHLILDWLIHVTVALLLQFNFFFAGQVHITSRVLQRMCCSGLWLKKLGMSN